MSETSIPCAVSITECPVCNSPDFPLRRCARSMAFSRVPGLPRDSPSNSKVESQPIMRELSPQSNEFATVCAFIIANASTISEGVSFRISGLSSSTPLTKTSQSIFTDSRSLLREGEAEAKMMRRLMKILYPIGVEATVES